MISKHSITIRGHRTSFSLEDAFWQELRTIALAQKKPLASLVTEIDETRDPDDNLSSAVRLYILRWLKTR
ncbi:MAG: ribbon-helix-helix domain-containing protein [Rhizobiaceae bacterium]|nr:ribbon-helix-helix domain-containing protein [Rhizobiaceae bacterium]